MKPPEPCTKANDFEYVLRSVQDPIDEPWCIFFPWYIMLVIPAFDFLTFPSPKQGWQKSMCLCLSCSSPEPGILTQNLCSWGWDATLWTEANIVLLGGDKWHPISHYRDAATGKSSVRDLQHAKVNLVLVFIWLLFGMHFSVTALTSAWEKWFQCRQSK